MKASKQMLMDAMEVACEIAADLNISHVQTDATRALYLCEQHGDTPCFYSLPNRLRGLCFHENGMIVVNDKAPMWEHARTLLHELAHRMTICTERFEHLNAVHMSTYDFGQFHELIAIFVEWHWLNTQAENENRFAFAVLRVYSPESLRRQSNGVQSGLLVNP
jgi:hypothetical protein